jgi:5,5'-dehydrodivanillate O-demethylase
LVFAGSWRDQQGDYHLDNFESQDGMAWETQGAIAPRWGEHLGASDRGIVMFREILQRQIEIVAAGGDPIAVFWDDGTDRLIDLEQWLSERGSTVVEGSDPPRVNRLARDEVLDHRHETFEVPYGSARPRN